MAFVPAPSALLGTKAFVGAAVSRKSAKRVSALRMVEESETASAEYAIAGKSLWKENVFTGGFPGGESFYKAWAEDGMTKDVPDMPEAMQPKSVPSAKPAPEKRLLQRLDATEFFKGFSREEPTDEETDTTSPDSNEEVTEENEIPDPALYEQYYPASTRYLAPDIKIQYEKDFRKDRVYLAMTEVTASATDVYFPKETRDKAPMIDISYTGSLNTSSVVFYLGDVVGLPTLPPPPKPGDAVTELVAGAGGGLKLEYSISGEGGVDI